LEEAEGTMNDEYSLFNAMDGTLLDLGSQAFDESLTMNLLFQEKILVHEALFFNCPNLVQHFGRRRPGYQSLFEAACKQGLVVPALRDPKVQSLEQAFQAMSKVYGADYKVVIPDMEPYRDLIIAAVDTSIVQGITRPFYWPVDGPSLGEQYRGVVSKVLQTDDPPSYTGYNPDRALLFRRVWELSRPWRIDLVEEAAHRTAAKGALGLQRAEVFNVVGWSLGVSEDIRNVSAEKIVGASADGEQRLAARLFVKWLTQCHHVSQARNFRTSINFPIYNLDQDFILDSILRSPIDPPPERSSGFRCEVTLPDIQLLAEVDPADLVAIRNDIGHGYLHALKRWQTEPSESNEEAVERTLKQYCEDITARYRDIRTIPLEVAASSGTTKILNRNLQDIAGKLYGDVVQELKIPILHQITSLGAALYRTLKVHHIESVHAPKRQELEVTLAKDVEL
jgi:hypothetical protein